ncbi:MAG: hypothetical protein RL723_106 [Actinomycetota bacterium]|jgi:hypothetical membrane protein
MQKISRLALIAATIGPVQSVLGWVIAGSLWPGYDPIRKTISDLAADDSPVQAIQSSFFVLGGVLSLVAAIYARSLALPGRVVIFLGGIATFGFAYFTTPSQDSSSEMHRIFAIASFVLFSAWPLFSIRFNKVYPWLIRPWGAVLATVFFTVISLWFLSTWTNPDATNVGLVERIIATAQTCYLSLVIWVCWFHGSKP